MLTWAWLTLLCWLLSAGVRGQRDDDLVVQTDKGKVRGVTLKSSTNKNVDAWYGIPFAKPPVGDLRFRHPQPADPWSGILETVHPPNSCIQVYDEMFPGFYGSEMWNANTPLSEDCLYLNVVAPKPRPKKAAVLAWVFGGGYYYGSITLDIYDMRTLAAEENIVMVSFQYRVAALGYLFFDHKLVPGNAGMMDQVMAMQWIRDNIEAFGGNPENITLFGESAGAAAVGLHLLSPLSQHLFSQAIMQSASATAPWGLVSREEAMLRGLRLAEIMKCPHDRDDLDAVIHCLRAANATEMVYLEWNGITFGICEFPFVPVVDGHFLVETPVKTLRDGNFRPVNLLVGANRDEANFFILYYLTDVFKLEENVYVDRSTFLDAVDELNVFVKPVGREAISFEYTNWLNPDNPVSNRDNLDKMVGDFQFTCPVVDSAHVYADAGADVYFYEFTERASTSPWPTWAGVLHADEIAFVFGEPLNRSKGYDQSEIALSRQMMAYWANFAKTGNPSLSADGTWTSVYWPVHSRNKREVLELNAAFSRVKEGHRVKKCAFWNDFLPRLIALGNKARTTPCDRSCCSNDPNLGPTNLASNSTSGAANLRGRRGHGVSGMGLMGLLAVAMLANQ